jgi:hypothetical protein
MIENTCILNHMIESISFVNSWKFLHEKLKEIEFFFIVDDPEERCNTCNEKWHKKITSIFFLRDCLLMRIVMGCWIIFLCDFGICGGSLFTDAYLLHMVNLILIRCPFVTLFRFDH